MKVLKKGRAQKGWAKEFTCTGDGNGGGGCGARLLVSSTDLYKTYRGYYDGSSDTFITFTCPECGVETDIDDKYTGPSSAIAKDKKTWLEQGQDC